MTGGSTYIVSIPKWWADSVGIKQGDLVEMVLQPDSSLLVMPKKPEREARSTARMMVSTVESPEYVGRRLIAYYLAGYNNILVLFKGSSTSVRQHLKRLVRNKLVGVEVVEESSNRLVLQCLLGPVEFPLRSAISRMYSLSTLMHTDSIKAVLNADRMLAEDVESRDDDVDRLYFYVVRQLKSAVSDRLLLEEIGLKTPRDCLGYRLVAKSLERIADHAVKIASTLQTVNEPVPDKLAEALREASEIAINVCENAIKALFREDEALSLKAISLANEASVFEEKLVRMLLKSRTKPESIAGLRLVLESVRRTAEYGADIAEIALNLTASKPDAQSSSS